MVNGRIRRKAGRRGESSIRKTRKEKRNRDEDDIKKSGRTAADCRNR